MKLGKYGIFVALIEVSGDTGRIGLHIMADLNFGYIGSPWVLNRDTIPLNLQYMCKS